MPTKRPVSADRSAKHALARCAALGCLPFSAAPTLASRPSAAIAATTPSPPVRSRRNTAQLFHLPLTVQLLEPLSLLAELPLDGSVELAEGLSVDLPLLVFPGARHPAVDQEG